MNPFDEKPEDEKLVPVEESPTTEPSEPVPAPQAPPAPQAYYRPEPSRHSLWSYLATAIIGAIVGGLLVTVAVPSLYGAGAGRFLTPTKNVLPTPPVNPTPVNASGMPAIFVASKLDPAVVGILNQGTGTDLFGRRVPRSGSGSGFIITSNGYIVTNNHVVEGANQITVTLSDGRKFTAQPVGTDRATDLAVIKINVDNLPIAELGNSDELQVGETVVAIGNPVGTEFQRSVTQGIVSGLNRLLTVGDQKLPLIQTDAVINPGNSGGPLANTRGQVVGINSLKLNIPAVEGMGFSIPINIARPVVNDLIAHGRVQRPYLGVYLIDKTTAAQNNVKLERGVLVADLAKGGPAEKAGVKKDDVITAIAGKTVDTADSLKTELLAHKIGDVIEVTVLRGGASLKINVTLGEAPVTTTQ